MNTTLQTILLHHIQNHLNPPKNHLYASKNHIYYWKTHQHPIKITIHNNTTIKITTTENQKEKTTIDLNNPNSLQEIIKTIKETPPHTNQQ